MSSLRFAVAGDFRSPRHEAWERGMIRRGLWRESLPALTGRRVTPKAQ
jgi:hypothetical protein